MSYPLTPSQTVGPYFHDALLRRDAIAADVAPGPRVRIVGAVYDGAGDGVPDAVIEAWQGNCGARVRVPQPPRARAGTAAGGVFEFTTVHPSSVPGDRGTDAPHIALVLFARGVLNQLVTRIYFPGEQANDADPVLQRVPQARRATLIAQREPSQPNDAEPTYRFDIALQGRDETVFFDIR